MNVSAINGLMFQLFLVIKVDLRGILNVMPKSPGFKEFAVQKQFGVKRESPDVEGMSYYNV